MGNLTDAEMTKLLKKGATGRKIWIDSKITSLVKMYSSGYSYSEMAKCLGKSKGAIGKKLSELKKKYLCDTVQPCNILGPTVTITSDTSSGISNTLRKGLPSLMPITNDEYLQIVERHSGDNNLTQLCLARLYISLLNGERDDRQLALESGYTLAAVSKWKEKLLR